MRARGRVSVRSWFSHHIQALITTLGQSARNPGHSVLTAAVIGIALALPAGLYMGLQNVTSLTERWQGGAQISVYLRPGFANEARQRLIKDLELHVLVRELAIITPEQALLEYELITGFDDLEDAFGEDNPLPHVLVVYMNSQRTELGPVQALVDELSKRPEVEMVQSDLGWLKRLQSIIELVQRSVWVVAVLFAAGVILIVGNTIRTSIQSRHEEIEVTKLVGGTDAFIRRPFLYSGLWFGLLGAVLAWTLVAIAVELLSAPVLELAQLYHSDFRLRGPNVREVALLLGAGGLLGLVGSWFEVGRQMRRIDHKRHT